MMARRRHIGWTGRCAICGTPREKYKRCPAGCGSVAKLSARLRLERAAQADPRQRRLGQQP